MSTENDEGMSPATQELLAAMNNNLAPIYRALEEQGKAIDNLSNVGRAKAPVQDEDEDEYRSVSDVLGDTKASDLSNDDKFENLTNKQLLDLIATSVDKALENQKKQITDSINGAYAPAIKRVDDLEQLTMQVVAGLSVNETRAKFPDFDDHKADIKKVMEKYPGMEFKDAYLLAKANTAAKAPPKANTETEKPNSYATPPSPRTGQKREGNLTGIGGFRSAMQEALDNIEL